MEKVAGTTVLGGLEARAHSRARSGGRRVWGLLPAGFPPSAEPPLASALDLAPSGTRSIATPDPARTPGPRATRTPSGSRPQVDRDHWPPLACLQARAAAPGLSPIAPRTIFMQTANYDRIAILHGLYTYCTVVYIIDSVRVQRLDHITVHCSE